MAAHDQYDKDILKQLTKIAKVINETKTAKVINETKTAERNDNCGTVQD